MKKSNSRRPVKWMLILLPLVLTLSSGCGGSDSADTTTEKAVPVTVFRPTTAPSQTPHRVSGFAVADEEALLSFKTGGVIESIPFEVGDSFRKGDILASLDITEVQAMVTDAEQSAMLAANDFKRIKRLYETDVATQQQFEAAQANKERAEAGLKRAQFNLEHSLIKAPFDGTVNMKQANRGEIIGTGQPVLRVLNNSASNHLSLRISVPVEVIPALKIGQKVQLEVEQLPGDYEGTVTALSLSAEPHTGGFPVEVELPSIPGLHPGVLVTVTVRGPAHDAIALPSIALANLDEDRGYVYLVDGGHASRWPVTILEVRNDSVIIEPTLPEGAVVIANGSGYVTDGRLVKVEEAGK